MSGLTAENGEENLMDAWCGFLTPHMGSGQNAEPRTLKPEN